jgi:hypothetical protein
MADDLNDGDELEAIYNPLFLAKDATGVITIDVSDVVRPDIQASNGIIHGIDTMLLGFWTPLTIYQASAFNPREFLDHCFIGKRSWPC